MYKGYKIRLYPTKEQEELFWKHIHACRFIWNYMVGIQNNNYKCGGKYIHRFGMIKMLPLIKGKNIWLRDVSSHSLAIVCSNLNDGFVKFFNKISSNKPKFKARKNCKNKFPIRCENVYFNSSMQVNIEKCGKVKCKSNITFPVGRGNIKVCHSSIEYVDNKWILSFAMKCDKQAQELNDFSMGIDLGIKELAVVSCDNKIEHFHNINKSKKMRNLEKRIKYYQRSIAKKKKGSNNREREKLKMRKLYAKQANIRNNYIHQTTRKLVNKKPQKVVMEDLNVIGLMKNHHLAKAIQEQKFYEFRRQMQYKCEWTGIEFVLVDRFYPSSKTCSCCGNVKKDLKLSDRVYRCEKCGLIIDRDENAAKNLEKYIV